MPLQSRASTARAARTNPAETQKPADVASDVQPRRGKGEASAPQTPPPVVEETKDAANDSASQNASQSDSGAQQAPAPQRARKPRESKPVATGTKVNADGTGTTDTKALKERLKEIEKDFKLLIPEEQKAMREVAQKFKDKRIALESEHRLITGQLSAAIFHG